MRCYADLVRLFVAAGVACCTASCRQVLGLEDYAPVDSGAGAPAQPDAAPMACGLPWGPSACASCVHARCCDESTACAADALCARRYQCFSSCPVGDEQFRPCMAQCWIDHPGLVAQAGTLEACSVAKCENECGFTCGFIAPGVPPDAAARCQTCIESNESACAEDRSCSSTANCADWADCKFSCLTPDCSQACDNTFDAGASSDPGSFAAAGYSVYLGACRTPCAFGTNWSCVGYVVWPALINGPTTLSAQVLDYVSNQPVSAIDVSICRFADTSCNTPIGHGRSDSGGNWQAQVTSGLGSDSFARLTSPPGTVPGVVPELKFIGYPVSQPQARFGGGVNLVATLDEYRGALSPTGVQWDASLGWIAFSVWDCDLQGADGVQVSIDGVNDPRIRGYYEQGTSYSFSATATESAASGQGGFVNVPPGQYTLTATPVALGKPSSHGHVFVQPGTRSVLYMYPTP